MLYRARIRLTNYSLANSRTPVSRSTASARRKKSASAREYSASFNAIASVARRARPWPRQPTSLATKFRLFRRCFCRLLPHGSALERPWVGIRSIAVVTMSFRTLVPSGDVVTRPLLVACARVCSHVSGRRVVGGSCAALRDATELIWADKGLTADDAGRSA